jgi:hypothetical protein
MLVENCNAPLGPRVSAMTPIMTGLITPLTFPNIEYTAMAVPRFFSSEFNAM